MSLQPENTQSVERLWHSVRLLLIIGLFIGTAIPVVAGIRGPGKYSGVVLYDRWDNCILFDGVYLMYISEAAKETLRSHQGQCVDIYAQDVYQPVNPGDGLIREFTLLGPCIQKPDSVPITGIELRATRDSTDEESATLIVDIRNKSLSDIFLRSDSLGFAVLAHISERALAFDPSDGPSYAVITRVSLASPEGQNELEFDGIRRTYAWRVPPSFRPPSVLKLEPGQTFRSKVTLHLPRGEYQFVAGYGQDVMDGQCVTSNAVAFDIVESQQ